MLTSLFARQNFCKTSSMREKALLTLFALFSIFYSSLPGHANGCIDSIPGLIRQDSSIHFIVMGDWGTMGSPPQKKVAVAMAAAARQLGISFLIAAGDNFYPAGVKNTTDAHWVYSFENVYTDSSLQCPWLVVPGNHDYGLNVDAQVEYTFISNRWYMPQRYYDTSVSIGTDSLLMVFLDTEPIERQLRGLPADTNKYSATYVNEQIDWLKKKLHSSTAKWKIVTGHHPVHTGGSRRHNKRVKNYRRLIQPVLYDNNVNFYFAGHEHHLEWIKPKGPTHFIISGAGFDTRHVGWLKRFRRFAARKRGFVTISISPDNALVQFIGADQKILYKHSVTVHTN